MKKYNEETDKLKAIYFPPYTLFKSYIFAIILSLMITSIMLLPLINLIFLTHYFKIILGVAIVVILLCCYLILYFKDKMLELYNEEVKEVNLLYIRLYDTCIVSIIVLIFYIIYVFAF